MKQGKKINEYIERFESKRNAYQTEVVKRKLVNQDTKPDTSGTGVSTSSSEAKDEDVIELIITETGFLKYFIKGITDKGMKRFVKSRKNPSLQSLYEVLRNIYDESDSEYDSESSNSSSGTDSEDEQKKPPLASKSAKSKDIKNNKAYDMEDLNVQFKNMALMIVEEIRKGHSNSTGQAEPPKKKKVNCYNCQQEDHIAQNCKNPCKLCKSTEHVHFQCPQYQSRRWVPAFFQGSANQLSSQSESMLIEEDVLMAEKRKIAEVSNGESSQPRVKRPPVLLGTDAEMEEPSPSRAAVNIEPVPQLVDPPATKYIAVPQKIPAHPLLPMEQPGDRACKALNEVERIVNRIVNEAVIPMSYSDVAAISPAARSKIKQTLTKPQMTQKAKEKQSLNDQAQVLIGEPNLNVPKGKSAPRTYGSVNGRECELLLDGGCTSYIVSLDFLRSLGVTQLEQTNASVMLGDGKTRDCICVARDLRLRVGNSALISVNALCFDVEDNHQVSSILALSKYYNIGTDWATHYWYIKTKEAVLPLDVHYVKNHTRESPFSDDEQPVDEDISVYSEEEELMNQDSSEEGYLIMEASDEEDENIKPTYGPIEDPEKRLGRLIESILDQDNITIRDKEQLIYLIEEFKDCFGTDYMHIVVSKYVLPV
ncbi:hypothetical protein [Parasitella parasitica]|uniref:CCHC-type domain-containing protein n=1 Tax=Parasitella parasitica TaxID=35722 RepID=A0A0B7NE54_9FUNG|nr:hypothetical protein [Parasitella parasitica]